MEAPDWLVKQMEDLKELTRLNPPTLEEVERQFQFQADWRKALGDSYR